MLKYKINQDVSLAAVTVVLSLSTTARFKNVSVYIFGTDSFEQERRLQFSDQPSFRLFLICTFDTFQTFHSYRKH